MDYHDRMRALREDMDLTQKDLGKLLGVNQETYSKYENGKLKLAIEDLIRLAQYTSV
ncbi:helix-turn-helix transcriptional regulator [Anaerolentibacter hominis]|uniref:helix-turn-helix domain-containing protein n=1 Tax=Anaerolentibacter hominis TaxID=3079009 RepID=UPI0031B8623E